MTVFGFQLVTTMIGACILSKIVSYFSLVQCVYCGLSRYITPSDAQLRETYGNCKLKSKIKKRRTDTIMGAFSTSSSGKDVFYFPRTLSIQLYSSRIALPDVVVLPLYSTFQWLLDFTVCALVIYVVTEFTYCVLVPWMYPSLPSDNPRVTLTGLISLSTRFNLSLVWLALSAWFSISTLLSITSIYFQPYSKTYSTVDNPGSRNTSNREWFLVLAAAFFHLILCGLSLSLDGRYFDFGFQNAYTNLTVNTTLSSNSPLISWGMFHALLALGSAFIGALFVYPGMKFGKVYVDAVRKQSLGTCKRLLFHSTLIAPMVPALLWVKPLTDHLSRSALTLSLNPFIVRQPALHLAFSAFSDLFSVYLHTFRLLLCLGVVVLRLGMTRWILQVYLDSAQDRLDQFNREPGRTSNKEVQRIVSSIFYCLNLVALQWIAPTLLVLVLACLYKNSASLTWLPVSTSYAEPANPVGSAATSFPLNIGQEDSWLATLAQARLSFLQSSDAVFLRAAVVFESVLGFFYWWCLVSLQSVSMLGLAYHRFISD